jgi:hypothetical protein
MIITIMFDSGLPLQAVRRALRPGLLALALGAWNCGSENGPYMTTDEPLQVCQPLNCDDTDPCTADACVAGACVHAARVQGSPCGEAGTCQNGRCVPLEQKCTRDVDCSDDDVCNGRETCSSSGACEPGAPLDCSDDNACTGDSCNPVRGCEHPPVADQAACGQTQHCEAGRCIANAQCASDPQCNDGNVCNGTERCVAGTCAPGETLSCGDGNACNGTETCDPARGCVDGPDLACADTNPCTENTCDPAQGCLFPPVANGLSCGTEGEPQACVDGGCVSVACTTAAHCDDAKFCTGVEACVDLRCVPGTPPVCDDGNACNGADTCDVLTDACKFGTTTCDDRNPCTADSCVPETGCKNELLSGVACGEKQLCTAGQCLRVDCTVAADCDDGTVCNGIESCEGGACRAGTALRCGDTNACNGPEACDPALGCVDAPDLDCADPNPCTVDSCEPALGCVHDPGEMENKACGDRAACLSGSCLAVACTTAVQCNDGNPCNGEERCAEDFAACVQGTPLAEGQECGTGGQCQAGRCVARVSLRFVDTGYFARQIRRTDGATTSTTHFASPDGEHQTYFTGYDGRANVERRSYFVFERPATLLGLVVAAELRLWASNPNVRNGGTGAYGSGDENELFSLFSVSTAAVTVRTTPFNQTAPGDADDLIFADLGDGSVFGTRRYSVSDETNPGLIPGPKAPAGADCSLADPTQRRGVGGADRWHGRVGFGRCRDHDYPASANPGVGKLGRDDRSQLGGEASAR